MSFEQELDPITLFSQWYAQARSSSIDKPNAMTLSTVSDDLTVSSRIVLLSRFSANEGFVFHTNYLSQKGDDIKANPKVALLFWWDELGYQIRLEGKISKTDASSSDEYFNQRPRGSQIGAWASEQSQVIASQQVLKKRVEEMTEKYQSVDVPRPEHWGGYSVLPETIEFWLNRDSRLHERKRFQLSQDQWQSSYLAP